MFPKDETVVTPLLCSERFPGVSRCFVVGLGLSEFHFRPTGVEAMLGCPGNQNPPRPAADGLCDRGGSHRQGTFSLR